MTAGAVRAPAGAVAWTPAAGFVYEPGEAARHVDGGAEVLVVSPDGYVRGVTPHDRAPLAAVLRVEGDVTEVVERLDDLGGLVDQLTRDVAALRERAEGADTGNAVEIAALRGRVRKLEERSR